MADSHDSRVNRLRHQNLAAQVDLLPDDSGGTISFLGTTTTIDTYPTTAATYYAVLNTQVNGDEGEGDSASFATETGPVMALNLGTTVPPSGSRMIVSGGGGRWTFRWDS